MNSRPVTLIPWSLHKPNGDNRNKMSVKAPLRRPRCLGLLRLQPRFAHHMTNHLSAQHRMHSKASMEEESKALYSPLPNTADST